VGKRDEVESTLPASPTATRLSTVQTRSRRNTRESARSRRMSSKSSLRNLFKKQSLRHGTYDDFDDPFADISDFSEEDRDVVEPLPAEPQRRRTFSKFQNDEDAEEDSFIPDDSKSGRLRTMLQSGDFTYVTSKMNEIESVKKQALHLKQQLNIYFNPTLVRAVLEILKAKEVQIERALDLGQLERKEFEQLLKSIEEVKGIIVEWTNSNTVHSARRALRRTKTVSSAMEIQEDERKVIANSEMSSLGTTVFESDIWLDLAGQHPRSPPMSPKNRSGGGHSAMSSFSFFPPRHMHHPSRFSSTSSVSSSMTAATIATVPTTTLTAVESSNVEDARSGDEGGPRRVVNVRNLLSVCIGEAFVTLIHGLKESLQRCCARSGHPRLLQYIERLWTALIQKQPDDFTAQGVFLDQVTRAIDVYHLESSQYRGIRRRIKECILTIELMNLQLISHSRLTTPVVSVASSSSH